MICSTRCGAWGLSSSSFMPIWGLGMRGMGLPQSLCCDFHQLLLRWLAEVSCLLRLDPRSEAPVPSALRFPQQPWRGQASLTKTPPMVALLCSEIPIPQSRQNSRLLSLWQKKKNWPAGILPDQPNSIPLFKLLSWLWPYRSLHRHQEEK